MTAQLVELARRKGSWTEEDRKKYDDLNKAIATTDTSPLSYSFVWVYLRK